MNEDVAEEKFIAKNKSYKLYFTIKRVIDIIGSILGIIIFFPLMLIISIAIKLTSDGPIIFKQRRAGKSSREFYIYKFRTMKKESPSLSTEEFIDSHRYITRIGRILRKTSLDEVPQLINVLKGEMSIVGPRPIMFEEEKVINLRKLKNVDCVLPGITGLAQINGRDDITVEEKVRFDEIYVKNLSLLQDFKIIGITVLKVIKRDGVLD